MLIHHWKTGVQYNMWVDSSPGQPMRTINCTRTPCVVQSATLLREGWQGNFPTKPGPMGDVPCSCGNGTGGSCDCKLWQWNSTFGVGCPSGKGGWVVGIEPERWLLGPPQPGPLALAGAAAVVPLVANFNDVYSPGCPTVGTRAPQFGPRPPNPPAESEFGSGACTPFFCGKHTSTLRVGNSLWPLNSDTQVSDPSHKWYHSDYFKVHDFVSPAPASVFAVPTDDKCPEASGRGRDAVLADFAGLRGMRRHKWD